MMTEQMCLCMKFVLWYVGSGTGIRVCQCGHADHKHVDDKGMCVGMVWIDD